MELYGGIDLHSNNSYVGIVDEECRAVYKERHKNELPLILSALAPYKSESRQSRWNRPSTGTGSSMGCSMPAIRFISPTLRQ